MKSLIRYICIATCLMDALLAMPAIGQTTQPSISDVIAGMQAYDAAVQAQTAELRERITVLEAATQPATRPAITIGIKGVLPTAGHAVHIWTDVPDYWRGNDHLTTTLIDPAGQAVGTQPDQENAFVCLTPGSYTVSQALNDGALPPVSLTILPPQRAEATDAAAIKSHTHLRTTGRLTKAVDFSGVQDVVWDAAGTTISVAGPALLTDSNTRDVTINNLRIDSPLVSGKPSGKVIAGHGQNISLIGLSVGNVSDGVEDQLPGFDGLLLQGASEDSAASNPGRMLYLMDSRDVAFIDCIVKGAAAESGFRSTAMSRPDGSVSDGIRRFLVSGCTFAQPSTGNKASFTLRCGSDGSIVNCTVVNAPASFNTGGEPGVSQPTQITRVLVDNLTAANCKVQIEPGASNITFRGGAWQSGDRILAGKLVGGGENFSYRKAPAGFPFPVVGISITGVNAVNNNHGFANVDGAVQGVIPPEALSINGVMLTTPTPKIAFAKDVATGKALSVGAGNVVKVGN